MMYAVEAGLTTQLKTPATTLYGLVSTRVYNRVAPQNTQRPYVIFSFAGGGDMNETPVDRLEVLYLVKGLADSVATALQVDDAIRASLHWQTFAVSGWNLLGCTREQEVQLDETVNGVMVYHRGALYRIVVGK